MENRAREAAELQKITIEGLRKQAELDERRAAINADVRKDLRDRIKQIGEENRALAAGANSAAGRRIDRLAAKRFSELYALGLLNDTAVAAFLATSGFDARFFKQFNADLILNGVRRDLAQKDIETNSHAYIYNDPNMCFAFETMDVPLSVKTQLDAEIAHVKRWERELEKIRQNPNAIGPYSQEFYFHRTMKDYAIRQDPETGKCAHCASRVDLLIQKELECAPSGPTVEHPVLVYYSHIRNHDGSRGQRVHISHELNDMDGDLNVTPQMQVKIAAMQPVPQP